MALFDQWPYVNIHDLNTDWLVRTVKKVYDKTELVDQAVIDAQARAELAEENVNILKSVFVTPEMYGAVGDGVADDTDAIQQALNSGVKTIVFSPKTYLLKPQSFKRYTGYSTKIGLQLPNDITIIGNGAILKMDAATLDTTYCMMATMNYRSRNYESDIVTQKNINIDGLTFDGNVLNLPDTHSITGLALYKTTNINLSNITMTNLCGTDGTGYGVIFAFCYDAVFKNGNIDRSSRSNIYCWESQYVYLLNLKLYGSYDRDCITCGTNTPMNYQKSILIVDNCLLEHLYTTGTHVIRFAGNSDALLQNSVLIGNSNVDGVAIPKSTGDKSRIAIINNQITNCTYGIHATGQHTFSRLYIENNTITSDVALSISKTQELVLKNNSCKSTAMTANESFIADYAEISDNIFDNFWGINFNVEYTQHITNNKFVGFVTSSYWVLITGNGYTLFNFNTFSNPAKMARIYTTGKAIGNHLAIDSTTVDTDQYNS